jgi:hypothetical protein
VQWQLKVFEQEIRPWPGARAQSKRLPPGAKTGDAFKLFGRRLEAFEQDQPGFDLSRPLTLPAGSVNMAMVVPSMIVVTGMITVPPAAVTLSR